MIILLRKFQIYNFKEILRDFLFLKIISLVMEIVYAQLFRIYKIKVLNFNNQYFICQESNN